MTKATQDTTHLLTDETSEGDEIVLRANIWRSPFSIAAAAVVAGEGLVITAANAADTGARFDGMLLLLAITMVIFCIGAAPFWNFLRITPQGYEQHAGLTIRRCSWADVQALRPRTAGAQVRRVVRADGHVRSDFLLNRYGLTADRFADLLDSRWRAVRYSQPDA